MAKKFLLDTNILVEHLKGNPHILKFLEKLEEKGHLCFSVLSQAEVYAGVREKEKKVTELLFKTLEGYNVDQQIAKLGGTYRKKYKNSHGRGLIDGMIAATAQTYNLALVTSNTSHFPMPKLKLLSPTLK